MNYAIVFDDTGSIEHRDSLKEALIEANGEPCSIYESHNNELGAVVAVIDTFGVTNVY